MPMEIKLGQDARGRWAWMLFGIDGRLLASDDDYREAALAMEDANEHMKLHERSYKRKHNGVTLRRVA